MSKSVQNTGTEPGEQQQPYPRAIVHKQILDAARSEPDASIDALAASVSGASPSLVEQVIDEYGDPAAAEPTPETATSNTADRTESPGEPMDSPDLETEGATELAHLSEKQAETLREIRKTPEATQRDLGERLGVTSATINQRVNAIDGFEWTNRERFVARLFDDETASLTRNQPEEPSADSKDETAADGAETTTEALAERSADADAENGADSSETNDRSGEKARPDSNEGRPDGEEVLPDGQAGRPDDNETRADGDGLSANGSADDSSNDPPADSSTETQATESDADQAHTSPDETVAMTTDGMGTPPEAEPGDRSSLRSRLEALTETIDRLDQRLENDTDRHHRPLEDPELVHKVVHACLSSEQITEKEELQILESLLGSDQPTATGSE